MVDGIPNPWPEIGACVEAACAAVCVLVPIVRAACVASAFWKHFFDRLCGDMFLFAEFGGGGCVTFSFFCAAPAYAHFGVTIG